MNNKIVIAAFSLFVIFVFIASLQTSSNVETATEKAKTMLNQVSLPTPTQALNQTISPTPFQLPVQHPGFRVNGGGEEEFGDE